MIAALYDWLLDQTTTGAVLAILGGTVTLSCLGLVAVHYLVPHAMRRAHNDVTGATVATVSVVYAVLLAFIAVVVWEDFKRAELLVRTEASLVGNLYRGTAGLPPQEAETVRHFLFVYAEGVIADEWPALARGEALDGPGWQLLDRTHLVLAGLHPADLGTAVTAAEMLRTLNALYDARRGRYHAAEAELPPILWWNLIAGGAIAILFSYLFGSSSFPMHLAMTAGVAASIALVLALIILLHAPFRGVNHVSDDPFVQLVHTVEKMAFPGGEAPPTSIPP